MHRAKMTGKERESRSKICLYANSRELLRGTLTVREHTCGKLNCKCARGEKHVSLYLTRSKKGKIEQLYISASKEKDVRKWVKQYKVVQRLLEEISDRCWRGLRRKD